MDDFTKYVDRAIMRDEAVVFDADSLRWLFAFKRMSGEEIMMRQLLSPSKTEEQLQTLPPLQMRENLEKWCNEKGIKCHYDHEKNQFWLKK